MARNVEIKARVESLAAIEPLAAALSGQEPVFIDQDDTFFACANGRLKLRAFADGSGELIFYQRADVMTVSLHADPSGYYPFYTGYAHERGHGAGEGFNLNLPLPHGCGNQDFLRALDNALDVLAGYAPQALVLALGFDTYKDDPISVLKLDMDAYRDIGARVASLGVPTVVVQEGGYMVQAIGPALDAFLLGMAQARA